MVTQNTDPFLHLGLHLYIVQMLVDLPKNSVSTALPLRVPQVPKLLATRSLETKTDLKLQVIQSHNVSFSWSF